MAVRIRGPRSRAGLTAKPVCAPKDMPIPKSVKKSAMGMSPGGGEPFRLSVTARMTMTSRNVPMNYHRRNFRSVI